MFWDCVKKTWVDSKTGKAVPGHFEGRLDKDGEIIPPPPRQSGAEFDPIDPKNAHNPETGQNLHWDRKEKTWKDSKTGKAVPGRFKGRLTKKPCPPPATKTTDGVKTAAVPARFELGLGYSYMHTDGELVNHLNGFVVNGFYNVNSWLAVGGEFSGLYGTHTDHYSDGNVDTSLDRYLYLFGPQVSWQPCEQAKVFGHVLVGGAHDYNQVSYPGGSIHSSANAFAMAIGGGVDVKVTPNFSISPSIDYAPTAFSSPAGDWQNNWRVEVVAKFRW